MCPAGGAGEESPSYGFAVTAPFRQGAEGTGGADCHSQCAHWLRNDRFFYKGCGKTGRPGGRPLRKRSKKCRWAGRCGERTERCQWQRKRSERVAAVKISSVRRKAAQKFWAPQQDHRPLRRGYKRCGKTGRRGRRPLRKRNKKCRWAGRCGHRPLRRGLQGVQQNGSSGKSAKRCQWQKKRGGFEEVPRLADTTVAGNRLARRWATAVPYEILRFGIFPGENFLRQGDSVISRLFSSGLPSTMGETKEGIA